jgi:hypothetical protein
MTPDGIPTPDWDRVHELAVDIANASAQDDPVLSEAKTEQLLHLLRELQTRYGNLPSIMGTLGDYVEDEVERYDLYALGIAEARRVGDEKNLLILLESILELESLDVDQRSYWETQLHALRIEPGASGNRRPASRY